MPKRLPARWQPESIREFRASAERRFDEGMELATAGYRTGAIYLWGYSAEMTLKAAYFSLLGRMETSLLTWHGDIIPAINAGRGKGIAWPTQGQGHNVRAWAELLVIERRRERLTLLCSGRRCRHAAKALGSSGAKRCDTIKT